MPMPFYLVTQTTLIEAGTEKEAAEKTLEKICSGPKVDFSVKYDEATVSIVSVPTKHENVTQPSVTQTESLVADTCANIDGGHLGDRLVRDTSMFSGRAGAFLMLIAGLSLGLLAGWILF